MSKSTAAILGGAVLIGLALAITGHLGNGGFFHAAAKLLYVEYRYGIAPETVSTIIHGMLIGGAGLILFGLFSKN